MNATATKDFIVHFAEDCKVSVKEGDNLILKATYIELGNNSPMAVVQVSTYKAPFATYMNNIKMIDK